MIKPKQPCPNISYKIKSSVTILSRKPSLPSKRNSSVISTSSKQSCLSDRIFDNNYKKNHQNHQQNKQNDKKHDAKDITVNTKPFQTVCNSIQNKSINQFATENTKDKQNLKSKDKMKQIQKFKYHITNQNSSMKQVDHNLTTFQWLLIMRRCFHAENKKRQCRYIKQRTLINYIKNKLYPNSLWNEIIAHQNQVKFSNNQIIKVIQKQPKSRINLDDIFICISKGYKNNTAQEHQSAAETARFVEQMKPQHEINNGKIIAKNTNVSTSCTNNYQIPKKKRRNSSMKNISNFVNPTSPMDSIDMNEFSIENKLESANISPISVISQTNNVSFSIEESSSQFSQTLTEKFESTLNSIQNFKKNLLSNVEKQNLMGQKKMLVSFVEEILDYTLYKAKDGGSSGRTNFFYGLKLSSDQQHEIASSKSKNYQSVLQRVFEYQNFIEYFQLLQAIKLNNRPQQFPYIINSLSYKNIKILNLANNNIRKFPLPSNQEQFFPNKNLQFLNLNNNKLNNIGQLLSLQNMKQLHLKNNLIDHVLVEQQKVTAHLLKIIDLSNNKIQKQEDLWALTHLMGLNMLNLHGNNIMDNKTKKWVGLLNQNIICDYAELYIFSGYTQYKDIAFETKTRNRSNLSTSRSFQKPIK